MRNHRMFSTKLITDDRFTALPMAAQMLYLRMIAVADDEGFVGNLRMIVPRKNHITPLISAGLVHVFSTGPALILHWFCHNAVKNSHAKQTMYQAEKALVTLDDQKVYVVKTEEENSGVFPAKEKKREEKKSKEKEREKAAEADGSSLSDMDKERNFLLFWEAYPKKCNEEEAKKAFMGVDEDFQTVMQGLEYSKKSNQWVSDHGVFIPDPKNWLKRKGWKDRPPLYQPKTGTAPPLGAIGHLGPEELATIRRTIADA